MFASLRGFLTYAENLAKMSLPTSKDSLYLGLRRGYLQRDTCVSMGKDGGRIQPCDSQVSNALCAKGPESFLPLFSTPAHPSPLPSQPNPLSSPGDAAPGTAIRVPAEPGARCWLGASPVPRCPGHLPVPCLGFPICPTLHNAAVCPAAPEGKEGA